MDVRVALLIYAAEDGLFAGAESVLSLMVGRERRWRSVYAERCYIERRGEGG